MMHRHIKWGASVSFYATHCLGWFGEDHICATRHAHTFTVDVEAAPLPTDAPTRPYVDLADLHAALEGIASRLRMKHLPDIISDASCEGIARHFREQLSLAFSVEMLRVSEDGTTFITWTKEAVR